MKRMTSIAIILAGLVLTASFAGASTSSGTMTVTATVESSISLTFVSSGSGISLAGSGSNAATMALGNVQAYGGSVPAGMTKSVSGVSNWTLSTPFLVRVEKANLSSSDYTLEATLSSADADYTWEVDNVDISDGTAKTITATGNYDTNDSHTFELIIDHSDAAGAVNKSISFVATSN